MRSLGLSALVGSLAAVVLLTFLMSADVFPSQHRGGRNRYRPDLRSRRHPGIPTPAKSEPPA